MTARGVASAHIPLLLAQGGIPAVRFGQVNKRSVLRAAGASLMSSLEVFCFGRDDSTRVDVEPPPARPPTDTHERGAHADRPRP